MGGVTAGLGIMYLLDPQNGVKRRGAIRDKAVSLSNDMRESVYRTGTDLKARATDMIHDATALIPVIGTASPPSQNQVSAPINGKA